MTRDIYILGGGNLGHITVPHGASLAVCNSAYQRYPEADYCFFQDAHFYETIKGEDFRKFKGRVLSILPTGNPKIELLTEDDITIGKGKKKFSAWGKNSGFHAICWAINQGYERVFLVGFDCNYTKGAMIMPEVIAMWQEQHRQLAAVTSCITNLTPNSGIDSYPTSLKGE